MAPPLHPVARLASEWRELCAEQGQPRFRALQIFRWIHARGVTDPEQMTDLPKTLRQSLHDAGLGPPLSVERSHGSTDGARKLVLRASDGALVETVLLPSTAPAARYDADAAAAEDGPEAVAAGESKGPVRVTQCISTQVGCAMGCALCASGAAGLVRHLGPEEIVAQVLLGREALQPGETLRNVLCMGMGEPLHNYEATARAIRLLTDADGLGLAPRRVTVSTAGLVPEIDRLDRDFDGQVGLAVSLHAGRDETRNKLSPIGRRYPLAQLVAALGRYRMPARRKITIEYTMVAGLNDSLDEARALCQLLRDLRVKVNLIPLNPIADCSWRPPAVRAVAAFQALLMKEGYLCFVRRRRGDDVSAACGQLALAIAGRKRRPSAPAQRPPGRGRPVLRRNRGQQ
jgi:23S rRNA (adenine2503-C2)-methyltransferase